MASGNTRRSFRFTCSPRDIPIAEDMLRMQGFAFEPDPFFDPARRLMSEPMPLGRSLAAFFGLIYIQDRSSMLPPLALDPPRGAAVLDMCASPGSKTSQLAWMTGEKGLVLGNEPSPSRLVNLRRNLHAMGLVQTVTCCQNGEHIPLPDAGWKFIQLDPPCSGWGTVEKHPQAAVIWKDGKTAPLIRLQRSLLREACRLLQPGGVLVYSTCTTNVEENERQVLFACEDLGMHLEPLDSPAGFTLRDPEGCDGVWRLDTVQGESQGFFVARMRKPGIQPEMPTYTDSPVQAEILDAAQLRAQGIDARHIAAEIGIFNGSLHALPLQALARRPASLHWQGLYMGKAGKNGELRISPRVRAEGPGPHLHLEGPQGLRMIEGLLQGQSLPASDDLGIRDRAVLLCWNGMPLCRLSVKSKRLFWSER
ncbi:MAG: RsmB/NOP family class I SAM-dependent RNA methyltransferase [Mailhella sp.]|nr:RsmB/NOP family class I SAM-dependent RNA methyltransferase [Mailhella sp.]